MNPSNGKTLWDSLDSYNRRNPSSEQPPSERIDPEIPGSHLWVVIVTNWNNLHPLMQDILFEWYHVVTKGKHKNVENLDPSSTEALVNRLEQLDSSLKSFELERSNLEEELQIRDRDFQRLRSITGKREKENIEVQHMLGKNFQEKIMQKQEEIDQRDERIRELEVQIQKLSSGETTNIASSSEVEIASIDQSAFNQMQKKLEEKLALLQNLSEQVDNMSLTIEKQNEIIKNLESQITIKDEKIREIKDLLNI